jgi:hypothetical protein
MRNVYRNWCALVKAALCYALQLVWCPLYNRWKPTTIVRYTLNASSIFKSIKFNMRIISPIFKLVLKVYLIITTLCIFLFQKSLFSVLVRIFPALYGNTYNIAVWRGLATGPYPKQRRCTPNKYTIYPQIGSQLRYHRRGSFPKHT